MKMQYDDLSGEPILQTDARTKEYFIPEDYVFAVFNGEKIHPKEIKEIVGEALSEVDGVLALKSGLTDIFKKDDDLTRGISVGINQDDATVKVGAKLIADSAFSSPEIISEATELVAEALRHEAGLEMKEIDIDVAESMSWDAFVDKYGVDRALH